MRALSKLAKSRTLKIGPLRPQHVITHLGIDFPGQAQQTRVGNNMTGTGPLQRKNTCRYSTRLDDATDVL